jgi:hypothetical protein
MIFRGLGVSRSSRRCFLVSSRRTARIKSLAGTCRHFNEQWYMNIQSPHMLHLEKVIRGKECRNGINILRDFAAFSSLSFDKSSARRHSEQQPPQTTNSRDRTITNTHHRNRKAFTARHTTQFLTPAVNINNGYHALFRLPTHQERHRNEHLEAVYMQSLFQPPLLCQSTLLLSFSSVSLVSPCAYTASTWLIDAIETALH